MDHRRIAFRQKRSRNQLRAAVEEEAGSYHNARRRRWQTNREHCEIFLAQMFVDSPFQRRVFGTEVIKRLIDEATELNLAVRLNVVRINPARRLYERLGFRVTHEDDRKFYMKRDPNVVRRLSN